MSLNRPCVDWAGQRIWVIGASSGIGAALSRRLVELGARVAVSSRNGAALAALGACHVEVVDITDRAALGHAFDAVRAALAEIDLVVVSAGTHQPMHAWELDAEAAEALVQVNLIGVINVVALLAPYFVERGCGGIALIGSVAGYGGLPTALVYGATKAALINFAQTLHLDLAPRGVAVYLINPGFVSTPLTARNPFQMPALISAEAAARAIVAGITAGRFEIHFPRRFTWVMKVNLEPPYRLYFALIRRVTGL